MIFLFSCFYCFLIVGLSVVWGGPFPWPSMTGVWSRAAAKAVARGNCLGGTFGGNCLENAEGQMPNDECMTKLECPICDIPVIPSFLRDRAVLVVARSRSDEAGTGSPGFAKTCAVPGSSRSELRTGETLFGVFSSSATSSPFSHEPGMRIKRAFSLGAVGCKEKVGFFR